MIVRVTRALVKPATALIPFRKKTRYRVKSKWNEEYGVPEEGFELDGGKVTPAIAFEMALIAMQNKGMMYQGVEADGDDQTEMAFTAIAIDILNRHFEDRPNLHLGNADDIHPTDEQIETMVRFFYSNALIETVREIPKDFTKHGEKF